VLPDGGQSTVTSVTVVPYGDSATTPSGSGIVAATTKAGAASLQTGAASRAQVGIAGGVLAGVIGVVAAL
jgi:hypothetical protein